MLLLRKVGSKDFDQVNPEELAEMFDLPYAKIEKAPEFNICPNKITKKPGQSAEISYPTGLQFESNLFFKKDNVSYELRYAENINEVEKGDKTVKEYDPRKVKFLGKIHFVEIDKIDLAIYMYLYPHSQDSPFRNSASNPPHYFFRNVENESKAKMAGRKAMADAMAAIDKLSGEPLRIIAQAFKVTGVDGMEEVTIKDLLAEIAENKDLGGAEQFNKQINSQVHLFKGIIRNSIDRGMFVIKPNGAGRSWLWNKGPKKGQRVVDIIETGDSDADQLVTHVSTYIQDYYALITTTIETESAVSAGEEFLNNQPNIDLNKLFGSAPSHKPVYEEFGGGSDEVSTGDVKSIIDTSEIKESKVDPVSAPTVENNTTQQPETPAQVKEAVNVVKNDRTEKPIPDFLKPKDKSK